MKTKFLILAAVVTLFAACKGKSSKDYEFINNRSAAMADTVAGADSTKMPAEKLVKTADINIKVKDVRLAGEEIASLTKAYGGMVMHHQVQSTAGPARDVHISSDSIMRIAAYSTTGGMMVRVPSEKLEEFTAKVSRMGIYVNMSRMDIEDKTLDYLAAQLKLKDRQELVSQQRRGKIKIKNPTDVLLLKDDMVDQKIVNLRTDAAVKFSLVSLNFYQGDSILKEVIANDDPSVYNIPFFQRLGLAVADGWLLFIDIVIALANMWVFVLCGLLLWRGFIYYKRQLRKTQTLTV